MKKVVIPFTVLILTIFYSCDSILNKPDEIITVIPSVQVWMVSDSSQFQFEMVNSNEIILSFEETPAGIGYRQQSIGSDLLGSYTTRFEYLRQDFHSSTKGYFRIEMEPSQLNQHGNLMEFSYQGTKFKIDMADTTIHSLRVNAEQLSLRDLERNGKSMQFNTTVEIFDTMNVKNHLYNSVIKFVLLDLEDYWTDETIVEFFYSKGVGLVKYVENGGEVYERIWKD